MSGERPLPEAPTQERGSGQAGAANAVEIEYAPLPADFGGGTIYAHDRRALTAALLDGRRLIRTFRPATESADVPGVAVVEAGALRRLRATARKARARRWFSYALAAGLPFLVGTLLGLIGVWVAVIPWIGGPVGDFIGTAGATVGGLPLAVVVTLIPSVWLIRRAHRSAATAPSPRTAPRELARAELTTRADLGSFLTQSGDTLGEIRDLLRGNPQATGERARRLADRFEQLRRLAAGHGVGSVRAFAADAGARFRWAAAPSRRLIPGLRARRRAVSIAEVLAPYDAARRVRTRVPMPEAIGVLAGVLAAAAAFLAAGVFLIGKDDALYLLPNEAVVFPNGGAVLSLGRGLEAPASAGDTISVVDREGVYWAWPRPLTDRALLRLTNRSAPARTAFPGIAQAETLEVDFRYDVTDLKSFAVQVGPPAVVDANVSQLLEIGLALFVREQLELLEREQGRANQVAVIQLLREQMPALLNRFVGSVNGAAVLGQVGIQLQAQPGFRIDRG